MPTALLALGSTMRRSFWDLVTPRSVQAYVSYRVRTRTTAPQYGGRAPEVIRRFSDFALLHEQLHRKFKGGDAAQLHVVVG